MKVSSMIKNLKGYGAPKTKVIFTKYVANDYIYSKFYQKKPHQELVRNYANDFHFHGIINAYETFQHLSSLQCMVRRMDNKCTV